MTARSAGRQSHSPCLLAVVQGEEPSAEVLEFGDVPREPVLDVVRTHRCFGLLPVRRKARVRFADMHSRWPRSAGAVPAVTPVVAAVY